MTPAYEQAVKQLKKLPGLGHRSAERIALHLLVEKPAHLPELLSALRHAAETLNRCPETGNLCEGEQCAIYADPRRDRAQVCVVEHIPDLLAIERAGVFRGTYHVLHGKLSPLQGVRPEDLNLEALRNRIQRGEARELILALSNDIEGEATCHYIQETLVKGHAVSVSRIAFGLPSGSGLTFADSATLRSALDGRRSYA